MSVEVTREAVEAERKRLLDNAASYVDLINGTRGELGPVFEEVVDPVSRKDVRMEINRIFSDLDLAINVVGLSLLLGSIDIEQDYPGFIVDELLGRQLAITIADGEPESTLAAATFHVMDAGHHVEDAVAGADDRACGVAAGLQVRLPGWDWQAGDSPYGSA